MVTIPEDHTVRYTEEQLESLGRIRLEDCEVSVRSLNALKLQFGNDVTLGQVAAWTPAQRMRIPNYGRRSENEIASTLEDVLRPRPLYEAPFPRYPPDVTDHARYLFNQLWLTPAGRKRGATECAQDALLAAFVFFKASN